MSLVGTLVDSAKTGDRSIYKPCYEYSSLSTVTGLLDAALRLWDDDCSCAKSQIRVAAAMLHGYTDGAAADAKLPAGPIDAHGVAPWQARKIREFVELSLGSPIRVKDCAGQAQLSAGHFSHLFKVTFGKSVCHYIRHQRIARAQQLMLSSREPLSQIALACGFADQSHYCRVFRDIVGLSPNAWRRRNMTHVPAE